MVKYVIGIVVRIIQCIQISAENGTVCRKVAQIHIISGCLCSIQTTIDGNFGFHSEVHQPVISRSRSRIN